MTDHMVQIDRDRLEGDLVMMLQKGNMMSCRGAEDTPKEAEWIVEELEMLDHEDQMLFLISELAQYRMAFQYTMMHLYWDKIIAGHGVGA